MPAWKDPNPGVRLCPFDMCPAMEHSAHKMAFVSLFESSTEPANPCNFKRTAVWLEQSRKMTQFAYNKAQAKRVAALKKIRGKCITPEKTKRSGGNALQGDLGEGEEEKVGSGRRLLGSGGSNGCTVSITGDKLKHSVKDRHCTRGFCDAESGKRTETVHDGKCYDVTWKKMLMKLKELRKSRQGVKIRKLCRAWKGSEKIEKYHIDALKSRKVLALVKEQIRKAYTKGFPLRCKTGTRCFRFNVNIKEARKCPGLYTFSVHLSADLGTKCTTPKCQKEFQGGCGPLSKAKRGKTTERPKSDFKGSCQPATGFLKISHRKPAATKQQGNKGSEVPIIWSKVDVDAGLRITKRQTGRHTERKQKQGIAGYFGGDGVHESMISKQNRVCHKLLEKDDQ